MQRHPGIRIPPRNLTGGVELQRRDRRVSVVTGPAIEVEHPVAGFLSSGIHVAVRLGAVLPPRQWIRKGSVEHRPEVARLPDCQMLHQTEQVRTGRGKRSTNVELRYTVLLPDDTFANLPKLAVQVLLKRYGVQHAAPVHVARVTGQRRFHSTVAQRRSRPIGSGTPPAHSTGRGASQTGPMWFVLRGRPRPDKGRPRRTSLGWLRDADGAKVDDAEGRLDVDVLQPAAEEVEGLVVGERCVAGVLEDGLVHLLPVRVLSSGAGLLES